jgi:hypothetical protein
MDIFQACMIAEGVDEVETDEEWIDAYQLLIDSGVVWQLQGFFGRTAQDLIDAGLCHLPEKET